MLGNFRKKKALLITVLFLVITSASILGVTAQNQATVNILESVGGSTIPAAGTQTYASGTEVTLAANPDDGFVFLYWVIATGTEATIDASNPAALTVSANTYDVQAVFQPESVGTLPYVPPANTSADAIVVVLAAVGGTTNPLPGIYGVANASQLILRAIPNEGWQFSNWIISGFPIEGAHGGFPFTATPTDNPYNVSHGEGNTYNYQPVFVPVGGTGPTPTPTATPTPVGPIPGMSTETVIIIALAVILIIVLIAFGVFAYSRRKK